MSVIFPLSVILPAWLWLAVSAQTKYPTTANYCDEVCYGGIFGYAGDCCMEIYCYCQNNGNFFFNCPPGQGWCPELHTCVTECYSECQCMNPSTTTTTPWWETTTTTPRWETTTTTPRWETTTTTPRWETTTTTPRWETTTTTPRWKTSTTTTSPAPPGVCPDGWVEAVEGCFLFQYTETISWREGQDVCESQGGYLAEVKTEDQQTFLESLAMLEEEFVGPRSWFIGLTDFGHEGRWIWHHSIEDAVFTSWAPGYPWSNNSENDCAILNSSHGYKWTDTSCEITFGSPICQRDMA